MSKTPYDYAFEKQRVMLLEHSKITKETDMMGAALKADYAVPKRAYTIINA